MSARWVKMKAKRNLNARLHREAIIVEKGQHNKFEAGGQHPHFRPAPQRHAGRQHQYQHPGQQRVGQQQTVPAHQTPASPHKQVTPPRPATTRRRAAAAAGPASVAGVRAPRPEAGESASGKTAVIAAILGVAMLGVALFSCYWTMLRPLSVQVNGKDVQVRVGTSAEEFIRDNDYFGAKAGRKLSIGGNVIAEDGGTRYSVAMDGKQMEPRDMEGVNVVDGASFVVSDGVDVTESSSEKTVALEPGIQMESGGAVQFVSQWGRAGKKVVTVGDESGEELDKEVAEPAQDMIIASRNVKPAGGKYIALTFDDGPSGYTPDILKVLKEKGAKATFYNLGSQEGNYGKYAKQLVEEGHELASHTNAHQYLPNLDANALRAEISSAADAISGAAGIRPQMIRAPYGAFTATEWGRAGDIISCNVLWNVDTLDWKRPGADAIKAAVLNNAFSGAIVLMHDGGGNRQQDVEALPGIIDGLKAAGYELVTVSELLNHDEQFPKEVVEGTVTMPKDAQLPQV